MIRRSRLATTCLLLIAGATVLPRALTRQELSVGQVCQAALWQKTFDEATAAGLNPGAIAVSFESARAEAREDGADTVLTGIEQYRPTSDVAAFPVRYECRVDRATRAVRAVSYVAVDRNGNDITTAPTELVKSARLLDACVDRLESGLEDDVRKRGVSSPSAKVEIALEDTEFVSKGTNVELQGRGRATYGEGFDWQMLIFSCRYDQKRQRVTREVHALETPSPAGALPAASRDAIEACRVAVGQEVLVDARQRGYRQLARVEVELPELADVKARGEQFDVSGRGQFRLDDRHRQPTPLSFSCTYDSRAGRVITAGFKVEPGAWTPSGDVAGGRTESLRCGSRRLPRQECSAAIGGNVRIIREFGSAKCVAYSNWMWSNSQIVVWDGCAAEFEYDAR